MAVCTDDMTVCSTNLKKEYGMLREHLNFTGKEIYQMNINAIDGAFISNYEKRQLKEKLKEKYPNESID